ncbi:radical SAM family heme chaperone HemW [Bifidobacterium canis]|uniref:Heme chaperone HemW n=1 Tax=Bifidobacterium canis TaxID=2610880 RepID=A0A7K1J378_9BIFI|nr:radical SAM family heme chaperone HemW [Bifidobacterium canis]MUH59097.1 Oxygen-independent coproporphyrinogen-III oxidase [Bifidobacterium canis]
MRQPFEVYVHVPFCIRRCGYCDFNTYTALDLGEGASRANYATLACLEMRHVHAWQEAHGIHEPPASTVFFGGGTPTILPAEDLVTMLDTVRELWGMEEHAEITTEANPDSVDREYLHTLRQGGFTRISFGMQSSVPHVLRTLDRTHDPRNVIDNVRIAKELGFEVSVDLIYGAPGESLADWCASVQTAIELGVDHISAYALTIEPHTKMGRQIASGQIAAPNDDDEAAKYEIADAMLSEAGLQWYEISNWAAPGHESRHNLGYWRNVDWAGIGPGAHSHYGEVFNVADPEQQDAKAGVEIAASASTAEQACSLRAWDIPHPRVWAVALANHRVPWQGYELISAAENAEEIIMLGIRLHEGFDLDAFTERTGRRITNYVVDSLVEEGLVTRDGERIIATLRGRLLNDLVIERLLDSLE